MSRKLPRILICGGRDFSDRDFLCRKMDEVCYDKGWWDENGPRCIVIGGLARGADTLGFYWADCYLLPKFSFPANWQLHGKAAGYIRNAEMRNEGEPDLVVAFPGGRGTASMISLAREKGIEVMEVLYEDEQDDEHHH